MQELKIALDDYKNGNDEAVLDVIANAISYTHLLDRHIQKENDLVYPFAKNNFKKEIMEQINEDCEVFEQEAEKLGTQEKYLQLLDELEEKYLGKNPLLDLL